MASTIAILGPIAQDADLFGGTSFASFQSQFNESDQDVTLEIFSPGGSVLEGLAIFDLIAGSDKDVTAKIIGLAGSIASIIPLAADRIVMTENAKFFIHNPKIEVAGDVEDLQAAAQTIKQIEQRLIGIYAEGSNLGKRKLDDLMKAETTFSAEEALEAGFIDEIIEPVKAVALMEDNKIKAIMKKSLLETAQDILNFSKNKKETPEASAIVEEKRDEKLEAEMKSFKEDLEQSEEASNDIHKVLESLQAEMGKKDEEIAQQAKTIAGITQQFDELKTLIAGSKKPAGAFATQVGHQSQEQSRSGQDRAFAHGGLFQSHLKEISENHTKTFGYKAQR